MRRASLVASLIPFATLAMQPPGRAASAPYFTERGSEAGLAAATWCGRPEKPHLLESGGTGLALVDYDDDGDLDLYLVNGWRLEGETVLERGKNALYRNRGDGTFEDRTAEAGVGDDGWGAGVAVGDVDADGWPDLLVTNFGPDVLYRNRGDGTFEPLRGAPGIDGWSTGAAFFDADGDGDEDLFVAGYVDSSLEEVLAAEPILDWEGVKVMLGPFGLEGLGNRFFLNDGEGRFTDRTREAGLVDVGEFYSFAVAALDLDADLDLDLYVANDSNPNYLYRNDGQGHFQEVGLWSGAALDEGGNAQAGMGFAAGDIDDDGLADILVTNFAEDVSTLYMNRGDFVFEDTTRSFAVGASTYEPLSWGTSFVDFDQDGDLDLFIANGHIYPQADETPRSKTSYRQRNLLLVREGSTFVDRTSEAGPGLEVVESSRGVAAGDLDGDGDVDLVVSNCDAPPSLLRNETREPGHWLLVDAPHALSATVVQGERRQIRHRVYGGSYVSVSDTRFHFGLGSAPAIDLLELVWPGGAKTTVEGVEGDRVVRFERPRSASE